MARIPQFGFQWEDEDFSVRAGEIGANARLPGSQIGAGIVYYSPEDDLTHQLVESRETLLGSQATGLSCLWNTGDYSEVVNLRGRPVQYVRVTLKPGPEVATELPNSLQGLGYAALLEPTWAEPFRESVLDDLAAIRAFVEPLRNGHEPGEEARKLAALAKKDLDLKLLWSGREFFRYGLFSFARLSRTLGAPDPQNGLINVTVYTADTGRTAVPGCFVWYVTQINHAKPGKYKKFSRKSTPTSEPLSVGDYYMWTELAGATSSQEPVSVISASTEQSVDLNAP